MVSQVFVKLFVYGNKSVVFVFQILNLKQEIFGNIVRNSKYTLLSDSGIFEKRLKPVFCRLFLLVIYHY